jgi:hypothetical protein
MRFRRTVCRQPVAEQATHWKYCRGCPLMTDCPSGETVEPDPPPYAEVMVGQEDAARPLVIAPAFPAPETAEPGLCGTLAVTFVGRQAERHAEAFWSAARAAGADPTAGRAAIASPSTSPTRPRRMAAARSAAGSGRAGRAAPRLCVELASPLFLKGRTNAAGNVRWWNRRFTICCASLRTVGALHALYASAERGVPRRRLEADFAGLKTAALEVPTLELSYRPFAQGHVSGRSDSRRLEGTVGYGVYADVPLSLVRWLVWGGRVHVGGHRVAGAGGWRVGWSAARRRPGVPDEWHWLS